MFDFNPIFLNILGWYNGSSFTQVGFGRDVVSSSSNYFGTTFKHIPENFQQYIYIGLGTENNYSKYNLNSKSYYWYNTQRADFQFNSQNYIYYWLIFA